jgi:hypothetical protein
LTLTEFILTIAAIVIVAIVLAILKSRKGGNGKLVLTFTFEQIKIKGDITLVSLRSTQYAVSGELEAVDRLGNPAPVEPGSVNFSSSDEAVFRVEPQDNEKQIKVVAVGPGVAELRYSADADLGDGVVTIEGFTGVEVLPAQAIGFSGLSFGEPQEQ